MLGLQPCYDVIWFVHVSFVLLCVGRNLVMIEFVFCMSSLVCYVLGWTILDYASECYSSFVCGFAC